MFTRGPVEIDSIFLSDNRLMIHKDDIKSVAIVGGLNTEKDEVKANAALIAAAFNAATEVQDMGYDGQKAIEMLPDLIAFMLDLTDWLDDRVDADDSVPNDEMKLYMKADSFFDKIKGE